MTSRKKALRQCESCERYTFDMEIKACTFIDCKDPTAGTGRCGYCGGNGFHQHDCAVPDMADLTEVEQLQSKIEQLKEENSTLKEHLQIQQAEAAGWRRKYLDLEHKISNAKSALE